MKVIHVHVLTKEVQFMSEEIAKNCQNMTFLLKVHHYILYTIIHVGKLLEIRQCTSLY